MEFTRSPSSMDEQTSPIVFVYGTLRRGERYHADYFPLSTPVRSARTRGSLYDLPAGYPMLLLEESSILAYATGDPVTDLSLERRWRRRLPSSSRTDLDEVGWVHGELIMVPDYDRLRSRDELEVFRPGTSSLFLRVLAPVWTGSESAPLAAWTYIGTDPKGRPLPGGRWPA